MSWPPLKASRLGRDSHCFFKQNDGGQTLTCALRRPGTGWIQKTDWLTISSNESF